MHQTVRKLYESGGSIVLTIGRREQATLGVGAGNTVKVAHVGGRLVVSPTDTIDEESVRAAIAALDGGD
ncbi:MAG: hypothetical protein ABEH80_03775, partial [Halobaculum sp.]